MLGNLKHVIALLVIAALVGVFYYLASQDVLFINQHERAVAVQEETADLRDDVIAPLNRLRTIDIDASLFSSTEYVALKNMSVELSEPRLERSNPFAAPE